MEQNLNEVGKVGGVRDGRQRKWEIRADRNIISGKMTQKKTRQKRAGEGRDERRRREVKRKRDIASRGCSNPPSPPTLIPDVEGGASSGVEHLIIEPSHTHSHTSVESVCDR